MEITRIGASSLFAAGQALAVRANNIVNAQTPEFRPLAPVFSPLNTGGGVALFTQRTDQQFSVLRENVGFLAAAQQYKAAASIIRRGEELAGTFLRTFA